MRDKDEVKGKQQILPGVGSAYVANQPPNIGKAVPMGQMGNLQVAATEVVDEVSESLGPATDKTAETTGSVKENNLQKELLEEPDSSKFGNPFCNSEERKLIEATLAPINFEELILSGRVEQEVPIRKGLIVVFQTTNAETVTYLERDLYSLKGSDKYVLDTFALMNLAASLVSINGKPLPPFQDPEGNLMEDKFKTRVNQVMKMPLVVIDMLQAHANWFNERVQTACSIENIKN